MMQTPPAFDSYKREEFSPQTLAALIQFARIDESLPPAQAGLDWEEVLKGLGRHALVGMAFSKLADAPGAALLPENFRAAVKKVYGLTALRMGLIHRNMFDLLNRLNAAGIEYMVVKGPAIAFGVYPDPLMRVFNDLDLIIRERDWGKMHTFLEGLGFEQEEELPQPPPKLHPQMVFYETKYLSRSNGLKVEVHYDDILNAGLAARDVEGFWSRSFWMEARGVKFRVLSLEDQLIHLCAHAHYHCYTRLNWFTDLAFFVRRSAGQLDWKSLLKIVAAEDIPQPVYYSLYYLDKLLGVSVPAFVLEALRPGRLLTRLHEHYMPEKNVLSMQPMRHPDFSLYFIPLYQRLLPTLLLMGRRGDNLRVLSCLVLPPRAWLKSYYNLDSEFMVTLHYVLHPLRLMGAYMLETVAVMRHWVAGKPYEYINKKRGKAARAQQA